MGSYYNIVVTLLRNSDSEYNSNIQRKKDARTQSTDFWIGLDELLELLLVCHALCCSFLLLQKCVLRLAGYVKSGFRTVEFNLYSAATLLIMHKRNAPFIGTIISSFCTTHERNKSGWNSKKRLLLQTFQRWHLCECWNYNSFPLCILSDAWFCVIWCSIRDCYVPHFICHF